MKDNLFWQLHLEERTWLAEIREREYRELKEKGGLTALINSPDTEIPDYLMNDASVIIIDGEIR